MSRRTYLVGGAIRDELLGLSGADRDWVVCGATPEEMLEEGFQQVGAAFPVFLHPQSREEYALARTERKQGHGYHGFEVEFDPDITIEQDLERRDLTINAIARDEQGQWIDPFGGIADLENRVLRHVSPAFAEDPLRVLRVARFAARFHELGFTVHADTFEMMRGIAAAGELDHLVPERAWREIEKAMGTKKPSVFLEVLRGADSLKPLLPEVDALFGIPQPEKYHPEIDTGEHLLLALDVAADLGAGSDVVVAVLLHDLGKALTPERYWPSHRGHEATGVPLVRAVCERFRMPNRVSRLAEQVCAQHLNSHRLLEARPATIMKLLERLDALRSKTVDDFVLACEADFRGRAGLTDRPYPQGDLLRSALTCALGVQARDLPEGRYQGAEIGEALRKARVAAIAELTGKVSETSA